MTIVAAGERAPAFLLTGLDGQVYHLGDADELVLAVFFKTSCATCQFTFPYLERLYQAYPHEGWHLWGVSQDTAADSKAFAEKYGATFPILLDEGWAASRAYDPEGVPTLFLIAPDDQVMQVVPAFQRAALNELSETVAEHIGVEPVAVVPDDDPSPPFKPG